MMTTESAPMLQTALLTRRRKVFAELPTRALYGLRRKCTPLLQRRELLNALMKKHVLKLALKPATFQVPQLASPVWHAMAMPTQSATTWSSAYAQSMVLQTKLGN